jgi:hypothetical protein
VDASNEIFYILKMKESGMKRCIAQTSMELSGCKQWNISQIENEREWNAKT